MKPLHTDYAHYYNKKYSRRGPLFHDRYKSIPTQDQFYIEELIRYIHLNPLRAGICKTLHQLDRYDWCGHKSIVENNLNVFLAVKQVLQRFSRDTRTARDKYQEFISAGIGSEANDKVVKFVRANNSNKQDSNTSGCWVIGDPEFQQMVLKKDQTNRLTLARYRKENITLEYVLKKISSALSIEEDLILHQSKRTVQADARKIFCHIARSLGFPTITIGTFLGIQQAAVSNAARKGHVLVKKMKFEWNE